MSNDAVPPEVDAAVRRCWRAAAVGASIGAVAVVIALVLLAEPGDERHLGAAACYVAAAACMGAALGGLTTVLSMLRTVRETVGDINSRQEWLQRIAAGKVQPRDEAEQRTASLWAAVYLRYLPAQIAPQGFGAAGLLFVQLASLGSPGSGSSGSARVVILGGLALVLLVGGPLMLRQLRRLRAYVDAHPVDADR